MQEPRNFPRLMKATLGHHSLGDMRMDEPQACVVFGYDPEKEEFDGCLLGGNIFGVRFPLSFTRELRPEEKEKYRGLRVEHGVAGYSLAQLIK